MWTSSGLVTCRSLEFRENVTNTVLTEGLVTNDEMSRAYEDLEDGWEFMNMDYFIDEDLR
jgi:hypothetical protein